MIIAICGFMGAGKSSILKQYPEIPSMDIDLLLESEVGPLGEFIRKSGWEKFRLNESLMIKKCIDNASSDLLLSLGGGSLDDKETTKYLKENGVKIVFLQQDFEICLERIRGDKNRPQLDSPVEDLKKLFSKREEVFMEACDFILRGDSEVWPTQWTLLKTLV